MVGPHDFRTPYLATGRIHHPNVVEVYDVGEQGQCACLVMELLRGESLQARLERGPLRVHEAVALLLPAMHSVVAAHRVGVIHRDLKPANIFLSRLNEQLRIAVDRCAG